MPHNHGMATVQAVCRRAGAYSGRRKGHTHTHTLYDRLVRRTTELRQPKRTLTSNGKRVRRQMCWLAECSDRNSDENDCLDRRPGRTLQRCSTECPGSRALHRPEMNVVSELPGCRAHKGTLSLAGSKRQYTTMTRHIELSTTSLVSRSNGEKHSRFRVQRTLCVCIS